MKRVAVFGVVGLILASVGGCGGPDSLMKEYISGLNDLAASIEKKESADKQKAIGDKLKATSEKLDKLKLSDEDKKKLVEKHKPELEAAMGRLMKAMFAQMSEGGGVGGMPNFKDILGGFGPANNKAPEVEMQPPPEEQRPGKTESPPPHKGSAGEK